MTTKLLVADDNLTMQKIVGLAFSDEDVTIEAVSSGEAALDSLHTFRPDIVLADVFMPGCNGYEVCARVKADPEMGRTPVVLLVGTFEPFDEQEAARVKCDGHITKPFDTSELIEMVRSLVGDKMVPQNSEAATEIPVMGTQTSVSLEKRARRTGPKGLVNSRILESFLGPDQVLELFDAETLASAAKAKLISQAQFEAVQALKPIVAASPALPAGQLSEDSLNQIVDKVVRRMSAEVVREVAWEVVPELSEVLIRRVIEERNRP